MSSMFSLKRREEMTVPNWLVTVLIRTAAVLAIVTLAIPPIKVEVAALLLVGSEILKVLLSPVTPLELMLTLFASVVV